MSIPEGPEQKPPRKWPLLDPKNDAVFKMMFASPRGRRPLIALLNAVLKPKSPICSVEVINPEIPKLLISDKGTILDIRGKLEDGTQIDVEMQMAPHLGLGKRALFYGARMYSQSIESGDYYHQLRPAIVLFFMAKDLFPTRPEAFHVCFGMAQRDAGPVVFRELQDELVVHFVEIPKAVKQWRKGLMAPDDEPAGSWLALLDAPEDAMVQKACLTNPDLEAARELLGDISSEGEARELARMREKSAIDYAWSIAAATDQGRAEGEAKGKAEGEAKGKAEATLALLHQFLAKDETRTLTNAFLATLTGLPEDRVAAERLALTSQAKPK